MSSKKQKRMLASNFKFTLKGLENASKRIRSIDSITIKESRTDADGEVRFFLAGEPTLHVSNVILTLPITDAEPWLDFLDDFVIRGNNADEFERQGSIELLDTSLKDTQFTLDLQNVGIVRARRLRLDAGSEVVATMEVELYCESVVFTPSSDAIASDAPATTTTSAPTTTTSAPSASQPVTETLLSLLLERGGEDVQRSLANVLRGDSVAAANPDVRAKLVAARLQSTGAAPPASPSAKREDGVALGERWASENAAFGELEQVARLEVGDWTAVRLATDHTLIAQLQKASLIPAGADGAFELERSDFVEGVIAGAAKVLRAATPHLKPAGELKK